MESTKQKLIDWIDIDSNKENGEDLNPIDQFLYDNEPVGNEMAGKFRKQFKDALNYWDEESLTNHNANVVGAFMKHCEEELGIKLPDSAFETYFNA